MTREHIPQGNKYPTKESSYKVYLGVHDRAKLSSDSGVVVRSVKNILRVWMKQGGDRLTTQKIEQIFSRISHGVFFLSVIFF